MRLERLIEEVMPLHTDEFEPFHMGIKIPIQTHLLGFYPTENQRAHAMGRFYEYLNRALYGGKLNDVKFDVEFENGLLGEESVKPDVIDEDKDIIWEAKAAHEGHSCNITNRQIEGYKFLQYNHPGREVLFAFYRHSLKRIKKTERTEEEIFWELTKRTLYSIILPLGVIHDLRNPDFDGTVVRHYEGDGKWPSCLCVNSSTLNGFLSAPEDMLETLGLNPSDFDIGRYLSPKGFSVNRKRVNAFPIVRILDADHDAWVEKFMREYETEMERVAEDAEPLMVPPDEGLPF